MDNRVNIAFVIDRMWGSHGGTEGQLLMLMNGLDESRFNVHLVCLRNTDWLKKNRLNFPVEILNVKGLLGIGVIGKMLEFRKSIGIGTLIQTIGENKGIEYIVLQDEGGLILASRNVREMRRIAGDEFLESALQNRWLDTRTYSFDGREVMEVVSPFQIDDESHGLFRIGLSMDEVRAVESRSRNRLILTALVVLAVGIVSLSLLLVSQNYSLLRGLALLNGFQ